jgi:hypothetical protein
MGRRGVSNRMIPHDNTGSLQVRNICPLAAQLLQYILVEDCVVCELDVRFSIVFTGGDIRKSLVEVNGCITSKASVSGVLPSSSYSFTAHHERIDV